MLKYFLFWSPWLPDSPASMAVWVQFSVECWGGRVGPGRTMSWQGELRAGETPRPVVSSGGTEGRGWLPPLPRHQEQDGRGDELSLAVMQIFGEIFSSYSLAQPVRPQQIWNMRRKNGIFHNFDNNWQNYWNYIWKIIRKINLQKV